MIEELAIEGDAALDPENDPVSAGSAREAEPNMSPSMVLIT
jgi:hypothetical protein